MKNRLVRMVKRIARSFGVDVIRYRPGVYPSDFDSSIEALIREVKPYTLTSPERIFALREAVRYLTRFKIQGAIVECGVWKGGSMMAVAQTLRELGDSDRDLYLFDTFEGMDAPGATDITVLGTPAIDLLSTESRDDPRSVWCVAALAQVRDAMARTGYPENRIRYVQGRVEETIPASAPDQIALLRLDTDWYSSTDHALKNLFPRLCAGGVLIIDDYGHWQGARQAVDEYLARLSIPLYLSRIDYSARLAIKPFSEQSQHLIAL